jgi:hypothetical protein
MKSKLIKANSLRAGDLPARATRERMDKLRYENSLGDFIKAAWHHAGEPQSFQSNWHIDCVTDHLMAVARREIKGPGPLIFTMPPRHMKSRGVNVFFPAWTWAQNPDPDNQMHGLAVRPGTMMGPGVKFAYLSYVQRLSNEHSLACRRLIESDWYEELWGDRVQLDYTQIAQFDNLSGGNRRAMSFSSITGFGADIIVLDDAHDIENVESTVIREATLRVWDEVLPTRLNDPKAGMFIVIMQRSHERDLIGHILAKEFSGMHVCLPAEFEARHPYVFLNPTWPVPRRTDSSNGTDRGPKIGEAWFDFRQEGDSLWKSRFPEQVLQRWASLPRNASMASSSWSQVIGTRSSSMNYAPSPTPPTTTRSTLRPQRSAHCYAALRGILGNAAVYGSWRYLRAPCPRHGGSISAKRQHAARVSTSVLTGYAART